MSEYERKMIRLHLMAGRKRKAEAGGFAFGAPPFGFDAIKGELVENPTEQSALARIAELRRRAYSLRRIAIWPTDTAGKERSWRLSWTTMQAEIDAGNVRLGNYNEKLDSWTIKVSERLGHASTSFTMDVYAHAPWDGAGGSGADRCPDRG